MQGRQRREGGQEGKNTKKSPAATVEMTCLVVLFVGLFWDIGYGGVLAYAFNPLHFGSMVRFE